MSYIFGLLEMICEKSAKPFAKNLILSKTGCSSYARKELLSSSQQPCNDSEEEGHIDPSFGMRLLREATEDIERSLSLATDVDVVEMKLFSSFNMRRNSLLLLNGPVSPTQWENEKLHLAHYEKQRALPSSKAKSTRDCYVVEASRRSNQNRRGTAYWTIRRNHR